MDYLKRGVKRMKRGPYKQYDLDPKKKVPKSTVRSREQMEKIEHEYSPIVEVLRRQLCKIPLKSKNKCPTRCSKCEYRPGEDFPRRSRDAMTTLSSRLAYSVHQPSNFKIYGQFLTALALSTSYEKSCEKSCEKSYDNYASTVIQRRAGCGTIDLAFELFAEDVGLASEDQLRSQNSTIYPHREQHLVAVLEKSIAEPLSRAEVVRDVRRYSRTICPVKKCRLHANSLKEEIVLTRFRAREYQTAVRDLLDTLRSESSRGLRVLSARAGRVLVAARGAAQPGAQRHRRDLRESVGAVVILVEQVEDQPGVHRQHDEMQR
ncbi:unnamed protein product [Trichogramma brassicae]|uniref:Uncharacterized protein n=1 Tax=Trichogramma brassicae TaxID=86971 RepID=A0A6H5IU44_9HYME|nr:unnamed protein product [Trichogramma brassicae]